MLFWPCYFSTAHTAIYGLVHARLQMRADSFTLAWAGAAQDSACLGWFRRAVLQTEYVLYAEYTSYREEGHPSDCMHVACQRKSERVRRIYMSWKCLN